jgi:outer membrane protein OmpA-like peptidoglycan-associated protein
VFGQLDVGRQTTAVTYPLDETVSLQFRGTTRFPRMKGEAKIKRTSRTGTQIELSVSKMPRPFELGAGYATYVLWAISPEGTIDNLNEIKRRGTFEFDSKVTASTPLQTFALIITAEPHFLVRRPSRAVMLENVSPYAQSGRILATTAVVSYLGNSSDYFNDARTPQIAEADYSKTPSALLQAKQAVALAKFAGAQTYATTELQEAETLLQNAERAWEAKRSEEEIDLMARRAISASVKAEDTAFVRKQARDNRNRETERNEEIRDLERKAAQANRTTEEIRTELNEEIRRRELAERDALNYSNQIKDLRDENTRLRDELNRTKAESEELKIRLARIEGEKNAVVKQQEQNERLNRLQANQAVLMQSLRSFGTVAKTERGIVLTIAENWWTGTRLATFAAAADPKLASLGQILANTADYNFVVESHTDNNGTPEQLQMLTQERADLFMERLLSSGVSEDRIQAKGFGATLPVAPNTTNVNRAKNRRVQVILTPSL